MKASIFALGVVLCLGLAGCPDDDGTGGAGGEGGGSGGEGGSSATPAWQAVLDKGALDGALLSVWGTSAESVYAVGGPLGNSGFDALVLHYDGESWTRLPAGGQDSYWWVHGTSDTDLWMVGEQGRITHYDGESFEEHESGTTATLWGAYAFAANDVWAVGGMVGGATPDDVLLHYDGSSWQPEPLPEALGRTHFKVWGTSSADLFVVGEAGVIWHRDGTEWTLQSDPPVATGNLTTVSGCSSTEVYAVGGRDVLRYDGTAWTKLDVSLTNDVNGVTCGDEGEVAIVGMGGLKQRLVEGAWKDDFTQEPHGDLHGVWRDETGAFWAVGGDFISSAKPNTPRNGIVARYGNGKVTSTLR